MRHDSLLADRRRTLEDRTCNNLKWCIDPNRAAIGVKKERTEARDERTFARLAWDVCIQPDRRGKLGIPDRSRHSSSTCSEAHRALKVGNDVSSSRSFDCQKRSTV